MASISVWTVNQILTVTTFKSLTTAPDKIWHNTYEVRVTEAGSAIDTRLPNLGFVFAAWEQLLHLPDVAFLRTLVSTYVPDGEPYDPSTFASISNVGLNGTRESEAAAERLPLEMCLRVGRNVSFGRRGMLLMRRCLLRDDVQALAGKPALADLALEEFQTAIDRSFLLNGTTENLDNHLDALGLDLSMAGGPDGSTHLRNVVSLTAEGVSVKKMNNRYFDKAPVISI